MLAIVKVFERVLDMRRRTPIFVTAAISAVVLAACAPANNSASSSTSASASESASTSATAACSKDTLKTLAAGKLTIGTDKPAYPPYFVDDKPENGQGFESAVAYAVSSKLGYQPTDVTWTVVPFDKAFAPGTKNFDFDINQVSITDERKKAVDFSDGYYTVNQAVVALKGTKAAEAKTTADLQSLKLGAQVGTTSLDYITNVVKPTTAPSVFSSTADPTAALKNKQIDALVVDLPTAYYITGAQLENSVIVGQFKADKNSGDNFGLVLGKGSPLTECINQAIGQLSTSGELQQIQDKWLSQVTNAPYFS